eukprot:TRINITY_DN3212_c1_g2_i2.p1 TRINITY_DN3212_c1_g2~~TRINITY_DN3212_c1_g2_i2.p1  ORF type:complete len:384 (+),score=50.23 TRINITY_DN3212_c1_g2_i2:203-1354(+)
MSYQTNQTLTKKLVLLNETVQSSDLSELPQSVRDYVSENQVDVIDHKITHGYEILTAEEVLHEYLPKGVELVKSYEQIGHIAHLNLRDDCLPYAKIIGQVILDKNKHLRTIVNKTGEIDNTFRTFKMDLLAGENDMNATVKEAGCKFKFNFAEVYWNSRLGSEHKRLVEMFQPGEVIADMFAGVGPFAVPASKKGCIVYANDLNPRSYHYLKENARINHSQKNLSAFNMDGRDFIRVLANGDSQKLTENKTSNTTLQLPLKKIDHIVMNLPASAVTFLDVIKEVYLDTNTVFTSYPTVHCYAFSKAENPEKDILLQSEAILGVKLSDYSLTSVRNVSPKKWMIRISFKVPSTKSGNESNITGKKRECEVDNDEISRAAKKQKL